MTNYADVNIEDNNGYTALMQAVTIGYADTFKILVNPQFSQYSRNGKGRALIVAARLGRTEISRILIDKGADVNTKDSKGKTALMLASLNGYTSIVDLLIKNHANLNMTDNRGRTALLLAKKKGHTDIAEILQKAGASR